MVFINRGKKKMKSDKSMCRLDRLLSVLRQQHPDKELAAEGVEAIVCNDGLVILNLTSKGFGVSMIKFTVPVDFNLDLTEEEMQDFNGGVGLRERYFPYRN